MKVCAWIVLQKQLPTSDDVIFRSWVRHNRSSSRNKGWQEMEIGKSKCSCDWCKDWQGCINLWGTVNWLSMVRISIICKEAENFPAVIEEGNYLLKTSRLNVVSSCGKSPYHGGEKEISLMVFCCKRCITKPSHYSELHINFVGKTAISSLEDKNFLIRGQKKQVFNRKFTFSVLLYGFPLCACFLTSRCNSKHLKGLGFFPCFIILFSVNISNTLF